MDSLVHWTQKGMRFVSYSNEVQLLQEAATAAVRRLKAAAAHKP
jgi:hypothetical protein